jgi:membrane fusion protein, multidrug efflux system
MKRKYITYFLLIAMAFAGWQYWQGGAATAKKSMPILVAIEAVKTQDVPFTISLSGIVQPEQSVTLKSRLDSQITAVLAVDGALVKAGDVLFELDDRSLKAALAQQTANVSRSKAALTNASIQYDRSLRLAPKGFATKETVDSLKAALDTADAALQADVAALENIKVQLSYTRITAPIAGRLGEIKVTKGNTVKGNDTSVLAVLNQIQPIAVMLAIPQRYFSNVQQAMQEKKASVMALGQRGMITALDNSIDSATGTIKAKAMFTNTNEALWPGMFVEALLQLPDEKGVLTIPARAVQQNQDVAFVYKLDQAGAKALKTPVEVVRMVGDVAVLRSGVVAGDKIVVDGLLKLRDGAAVVVQGTP